MNKSLSAGVGLVFVASILLAVWSLSHGAPQSEPKTPTVVGSASSVDIVSPYFDVGGQYSYFTPISCNSATSTMFGIANPWNATSTAKLIRFSATGNATTTTLKIGTSTTATGVPSTIYAIMVNASIASTTGFSLASGIRNGPVGGFIDAGASTVSEVMVGPTESIAGFATTTASGAGAAQYSGGYTSCSGMIRWERGF
jgi:hypothetical protein